MPTLGTLNLHHSNSACIGADDTEMTVSNFASKVEKVVLHPF